MNAKKCVCWLNEKGFAKIPEKEREIFTCWKDKFDEIKSFFENCETCEMKTKCLVCEREIVSICERIFKDCNCDLHK